MEGGGGGDLNETTTQMEMVPHFIHYTVPSFTGHLASVLAHTVPHDLKGLLVGEIGQSETQLTCFALEKGLRLSELRCP